CNLNQRVNVIVEQAQPFNVEPFGFGEVRHRREKVRSDVLIKYICPSAGDYYYVIAQVKCNVISAEAGRPGIKPLNFLTGSFSPDSVLFCLTVYVPLG